jgi:hypothetical protein
MYNDRCYDHDNEFDSFAKPRKGSGTVGTLADKTVVAKYMSTTHTTACIKADHFRILNFYTYVLTSVSHVYS